VRILTDKQYSVLMALTDEWQTPTQIAGKLEQSKQNPTWAALYGSSYVNQPLKALVKRWWVEVNPDKRGQYRLSDLGKSVMDEVRRVHAN